MNGGLLSLVSGVRRPLILPKSYASGPTWPDPMWAFDARDLANGSVSSWTSSFGSLELTATGTRQPTRGATSLAGSPGVRFDATDVSNADWDNMVFTSALSAPSGSSTVGIVMLVNSYDAVQFRMPIAIPHLMLRVIEAGTDQYKQQDGAFPAGSLGADLAANTKVTILYHRREDPGSPGTFNKWTLQDSGGANTSSDGPTGDLSGGAGNCGVGSSGGYGPWSADFTLGYLAVWEPAVDPGVVADMLANLYP